MVYHLTFQVKPSIESLGKLGYRHQVVNLAGMVRSAAGDYHERHPFRRNVLLQRLLHFGELFVVHFHDFDAVGRESQLLTYQITQRRDAQRADVNSWWARVQCFIALCAKQSENVI